MNEAESIATWNVLRDLGFELDADVISDAKPGLSFDFGNFKLSATSCLNLRFVDVVLFGGVMRTRRTLGSVTFEMPTQIESREQCAAWIVWHLDKHSEPGPFIPLAPAPWLEMGREHTDSLPWERQRRRRELNAELYRVRPHCRVARKCLRLALNTMAEHLEKAKDEDPVKIRFKDGVLSIHVVVEHIVIAADGDSWHSDYVISAGRLKNLPKRLMTDPVTVGIWESKLELDRYRYAGVSEDHESNEWLQP